MEQTTVWSLPQNRQGTVSLQRSPISSVRTADFPQGQGSSAGAAASWNTLRSMTTGWRHTGQRYAMVRFPSSTMGPASKILFKVIITETQSFYHPHIFRIFAHTNDEILEKGC